jgi:hypothetical protein
MTPSPTRLKILSMPASALPSRTVRLTIWQGKPLPLDGDPENVLLNRLMRENGAVPEFVSLSRELERLRGELADVTDRAKRADTLKDMSLMDAKIDLARNAYRK